MSPRPRIVGIIPAHMASIRFPGKILYPFAGLPMIEHVRRRALLSDSLAEVYVATCDDDIEAAVTEGGGKVIRTSDQHRNGTSRIAEAMESLDATHVILLQGDEPLLLPSHVDALAEAMTAYPHADAWNATCALQDADELDRHSFVKCAVGAQSQILYCFRRSPSTAPFEVQTSYIRKILGLFGFTRTSLKAIAQAAPSIVETHESIEQMRIIETGKSLISVPVNTALPSVNEPQEADIILNALKNNPEQTNLLNRILK